MGEILQNICFALTIISTTTTLLVLCVKPIRNRMLGIRKQQEEEARIQTDRAETEKCLLRDRIVHCYYKHKEDTKLQSYEFENVEKMYRQYKKLGGNSFVDRIWEEMRDWTII